MRAILPRCGYGDRPVPWAPPSRSPWADKMVALGRGLGDDGRSMISLAPEDLRGAAVSTTGLDDFGDRWWEEPFRAPVRLARVRGARCTCRAESAPAASSS